MIKLIGGTGHVRGYQFRPNHDRRKIFGRFDLRSYADRYEIWSLSIIGEQRNKGYGKQMLTEFLQQFKADKPLFLYVFKTNEIAIRLYQKVGFTIVDDDRYNGIYKMQYVTFHFGDNVLLHLL